MNISNLNETYVHGSLTKARRQTFEERSKYSSKNIETLPKDLHRYFRKILRKLSNVYNE